ncbi:hypothetical protein [Mycoplasma sp. P36-A1]|uniref:hypothetical protein n=1 Tax=Mycoplasma sp. P36-A1 TaxID=3252900 RepID=UPI003C2CF92F
MLDQYSNESKADPRIRSSNKLCDSTSTRTDKYNSAGRLIQRTCYTASTKKIKSEERWYAFDGQVSQMNRKQTFYTKGSNVREYERTYKWEKKGTVDTKYLLQTYTTRYRQDKTVDYKLDYNGNTFKKPNTCMTIKGFVKSNKGGLRKWKIIVLLFSQLYLVSLLWF